jgi:hypothetical protein
MEFIMAKSHHDVGVAFGKLQKAAGSRMTTERIYTPTPNNDDMAVHTNKVFYILQAGVSYRTTVARIMRNVHTKRNELWLTTRRYSSSTTRHMGYLQTGFRKAYGYDTVDIFHTPCIEDGRMRHDPSYVLGTVHNINVCLSDVDKPRLREATRRGTLTSCLHRANITMHNFTRGIPLDVIDAPALYELQTTIDFLTTTLGLECIDEVRAVVRGHLALNRHN